MSLNRSDTLAAIQMLVGTDISISVEPYELDYICNLENPYQEIALYQAAYGQLVKLKINEPLQQKYFAHFQELGKKVAEYELDAYHKKAAWADKYGELKMVPKNGQLKADLGVPVEWQPFDCELCEDTGWRKNYNTLFNKGKKYPCSCAKGDEKAKKTDYMGPVTPINSSQKYKPAPKEQQALSNQMSPAAQMQSQAHAPLAGLLGLGGIGLGAASNQQAQTKASTPAQPAVPKSAPVPALPEPTGRRFRR